MIHIAFIISGLHNAAGMERVLSIRMNELCNYFNVTAITHNQCERPDFFPLDKRIERVDIVCSPEEYKQKFSTLLIKRKFDITVSTGGAEFFFLHSVKDGSKKIFEFHFSFDIAKVWIGQHVKGFRRWRYIQQQTWHRIYHARKYNHIVVLCKADYKKWKRYCRHVSYIYNPLTIENKDVVSACTEKRAIAVGRLNYQKGFDYLIDVWRIVAEQHPEWQLNIFGEGDERESLQKQIDKNKLNNHVFLCGSTNDIVEKYVESSIFVLSSRDEAFGLVITEAEACGLPIVTFDCPSAPKELVADGENGYVVSLGNIEAMATKINTLIENEQLRKEMGKKSLELAEKFDIKNITKEWITLYKGVLIRK